ncbi:MAG: ParA family protein [Chloroflexota bacterium]
MRKIAIVGFKGGIGKTTTCVSLGAALALRKKKVLLIDTDTQANVSISLGVQDYKYSLADVLSRTVEASDTIISTRRNLHLIPASLGLFKAQQRMVMEMAREEIFNELFADLTDYDYHILDCAPSATLLTVNAIAYVDEVFIPVSMEMLALAGARQFMSYLREISRMLGSGGVIRLIIPTMYDRRRRVSRDVLRQLKKDFGDRVTDTIGVDTQLSEAPGKGQTIFEYAPRSRGAKDYGRLAETVLKMPPIEA